MSIQVSSLLKQYNTQKAVNNISFTLGKGEIVGFLGPNGAGKSTTMKMITGFLQPDAGTVQVCGISIAENPLAAKAKIGYLPEANPLYYDMYVKEYLLFIAAAFNVPQKTKAVNEVIELVGLTVEKHKKTGQLSKGYKQRVGLAAALIHQPEVLILDEPTSGLDPNQITEIRTLIKEQGKNKTVLFSSHILQEVQAICDRVIIINKGEIVADDTLKNLKQKDKGDKVLISFKEILHTSDIPQLTSAKKVNQLNENTWQVITTNAEETKKELLQFALQQQLNIISLQTETGNLEDVFKAVTGG